MFPCKDIKKFCKDNHLEKPVRIWVEEEKE
jgi:hypothetical protein